MPENFHSPFHPTTKAGQTAEGQLIYDEEQRRLAAADRTRRSPAANAELGPFGKKFVGLGLVLLGLWTAPDVGAAGAAWIVPGSLLALGALGLIKGMWESWGEGWRPFEDAHGRSSTILRFLWALRPRLWLFAWIVIVGVFISWGSPHLLWEYGGGDCTYLGLNGVEEARVYGDCPIVRAFPLR